MGYLYVYLIHMYNCEGGYKIYRLPNGQFHAAMLLFDVSKESTADSDGASMEILDFSASVILHYPLHNAHAARTYGS